MGIALCAVLWLCSSLAGHGQAELDSLYCRLQTRLEVAATLAAAKESTSVIDTLSQALEQFPVHPDARFQRLLAEYHFWIGYAAFYRSYASHSQMDDLLGKNALVLSDSLSSGIYQHGSELKARILRMKGMFAYFMEENAFDAQHLYEDAYREWLRVPQKDSMEMAIVLQCMGQAAGKIGEYEKAIDLYKQSLGIRERIFGKTHSRVGHAYWNLGNAYYKSIQYEQAKEAYRAALDIIQSASPNDHRVIASITSNLATTFGVLGDYPSSMRYHMSAIQIIRDKIDPNSLELIHSLHNLALIYGELKDFPHAYASIADADDVCERLHLDRGSFFSRLRLSEAVILEKSGNVQGSLAAVQTAMKSICPRFDSQDWHAFPHPSETADPMLLQKIALYKSENLYRRADTATSWLDYLEICLKGYELAAQLSDRLRASYQDQDDKLFLSGRDSKDLENALTATSRLWNVTHSRDYLARAFRFMEQTKFQLLLEHFRKSRMQMVAQVGSQVIMRLDALRRRCAELDYQLSLPTLPLDSQRYFRTELLEKRLCLRSLQDSLEKESAHFRAVNGIQTLVDLDSLQSQLGHDQACLISYALTDSSLFTCMVQADTVTLSRRTLFEGFADSLARWLDLCRRPLSERREEQALARLGHRLYHILIAPEIQMVTSPVNRIIIIPDGRLGNVPFEALVEQLPEPGKENCSRLGFLVRKYNIQYAPSATLWNDQRLARKELRPLTCLGIAWGDVKVDSLPGIVGKIPALKGTETELEGIQGAVAGKFFLAHEATEANFKAYAPHYDILHLALHAVATGEEPRVLFPSGGNSTEDGVLHFHELFPLHLKSRLVILSACETGAGKLLQGEGIQSMSSGFAAAGVPSLLMSLWEVDDQAGSDIVQRLYEGIAMGKKIDESLRQAKLHYLENAKGFKAAPFYWSAFAPMGNMAPVQLAPPPSHSWRWVLLMGAAMLLCIFITYRIYTKNRKSI